MSGNIPNARNPCCQKRQVAFGIIRRAGGEIHGLHPILMRGLVVSVHSRPPLAPIG